VKNFVRKTPFPFNSKPVPTFAGRQGGSKRYFLRTKFLLFLFYPLPVPLQGGDDPSILLRGWGYKR